MKEKGISFALVLAAHGILFHYKWINENNSEKLIQQREESKGILRAQFLITQE